MEKIVKKSAKTQKIKDTSSIALRNVKKEKYIKNIKKKKDKLKFNHNYNITLNFNNYPGHNHNQKQKKEDGIKTKSKEIIDYIDEELNNLSYKLALKYDKRTYFEYYLSLIKTKHIFIFSFCYNKDYNSKIIKIDLFLMNFIMNYTINALFFNDETMHKIYIDQCSFNFIYQLPQIIYSTLISAGLSIPLEYSALSDISILELTKIKRKSNLYQRINEIKQTINIKIIIYFIISCIFLFCFWYYLSMFGAVYRNTQYHLIKDTIISFCLSLIYPFFIYLIPGIFRIPALSDSKNKRKCLYNIGLIFQMI